METRPEFTVIAGPNGAGKSRLSPYYIHCPSFDGDLLALNLQKEHPDWEERWISGTVAGELQKQKDNAIALRKDFAFETNFSNNLILNLIGEFKEVGYKISLFYFGLGSLEECTLRVMQRKMLGGHDVPNKVIEAPALLNKLGKIFIAEINPLPPQSTEPNKADCVTKVPIGVFNTFKKAFAMSNRDFAKSLSTTDAESC